MQKKFILNLILLLFLNLLIKPFYIFFIDVNVQRIVGLSEYGLYLSIFNFTYVINILLDMGITNFNNKNIAQNSQVLTKYFTPIIIIRLILAIAYILVAYILALLMHYDNRQLGLLGVLAINQFLLSSILYLRSNISGLLHFVEDSFISVLDKALLIIFCLILLYSKFFSIRFNIEWFIYAQTLSYIITLFVALAVVLKYTKFTRPKINKPLFMLILRKSFPFALLTLLMACYNKIDTVMIKQILQGNTGNVEVGIYAHSVRVLDAMNNFSYLFAVLLLPIYAKMLKKGDSVRGITKTAFGLLLCFSLTISTLCMYYGYDIMDLMYDEEISYSFAVFKVLIYCFPSMSIAYIFGTLLTASGSLRELNIISIFGLIINVILNFVFIPRLGALGAAYTGVITQFFVVICQIIVTVKIFKVDIDKEVKRYVFSFIVFLVLLFLMGYGVKMLQIKWYYSCILHLCLGVVIAMILRIFDVKELLLIVRKKSD